MADIFVSYASEDRERVRPIVEELEARGFSVWWDTRIGIGASFDREIERELRAASCVVTVWSTASVDSDWVREETQDGLDRNILVPIQIDDCRLPLGFRRTQTAQLFDWPDTQHDLSELVDRIADLTREVAMEGDSPMESMAASDDAMPKGEPPAEFAAALEAKPSPDTEQLQRGAPVRRRSGLHWLIGGAVGLIVLLVFFATRSVWLPPGGGLPVPTEHWDQLTNYPDSASQPALSPDGRILTFIRGGGSFVTPGQIYSKLLPNGTPARLTEDDSLKMSPVFSPDGSEIAYTVVSGFEWDTWRVGALGGRPGHWLRNASGLTWTDEETLLFSEIIPESQGIHMKIVVARETRAEARDVYVPDTYGMAHRSAASPDGAWAIVVEMDETAAWVLPCRLVPLRGTAPSRRVGPHEGGCTFAAWSPDGEWMYFNSRSGGANHIWRQQFPDGDLQQVTSGATEEEGIAISPAGDSLTTAVTLKKSSVWISDRGNVRAISSEGYAFDPEFTPDGVYLLFRILEGTDPVSDATELWIADLQSGRTEPFLPGFSLFGSNVYSISADGSEVVIAALDSEGRSRLWLAPLDRGVPPRQVPNVEGHAPFFGADGEIFFSTADASAADTGNDFVFRVKQDGTGLRRVIEWPVAFLSGISPDGAWLVAHSVEGGSFFTWAFPLEGGEPIRLYSGAGTNHKIGWTSDGRFLLLPSATGGPWLEAGGGGHTNVIPIPPGQVFPDIPPEGYASDEVISAIPDVRVIESGDVAPGTAADIFAYSQQSVQRNLYRIPLP
jgi:Tol biopolymer transport system component